MMNGIYVCERRNDEDGVSETRCWAMLLTYLNGTASTGMRSPQSSSDTESLLAGNDSERPAQVIAELARRDHEILRRNAISTRAKRQERQRGTTEKMRLQASFPGTSVWGQALVG